MTKSERAIIQAIDRHRTFVVTMHVNPDPDALGAAMALTLFLRRRGKTVRLLNDGPLPAWLTFMPHGRRYQSWDEHGGRRTFSPEVAFVLDSGELSRTGRVAGMITDEMTVINIDHHLTNARFGDLNLVDVKASSTCEIIYRLLKAAGCRLTRDIAILLYLGILTDTGSFAFDATGPGTHEAVADLMKTGFSVSEMYRAAYETLPRRDLKPLLALMATLTLHAKDRLACLTISAAQARKFSAECDLRDRVFSFLRGVKGLDVVLILTQQGKTRTRLNFRSRGAVDVATFASRFGGGGHRNASGGFIDLPLGRAKTRVVGLLTRELSC